MKDILNKMATAAKANLVKDGYLAPVFMWFKNKELIAGPQLMIDFKIPPDQNKDKNILAAGVLARAIKADSVLMVWDAAMRSQDPNQPYDYTESPLTYPKAMRTECIIIQAIQLPSGKENVLIIPYKGGDGIPVEFLPEIPNMDHYESRLAKILLEGWNFPV